MEKHQIAHEFRLLQDFICQRLESIDGVGVFIEDQWERNEGGGGRTRILNQGQIIEKGGVAFSEVYGPLTEMMRTQMQMKGDAFFACGVSIVLHPKNVHVPIIHMNVRYFELDNGEFWFGGGIDLTPHYVVKSQAKAFHISLKQLCDEFDPSFYPKFKPWADDYFFIPHRNETRGIGGIFFDHLKPSVGLSKVDIFNFCLKLGRLFPELYDYQVQLGKDKHMSDIEKKWRNIRRGRYVEFNLVYDRGTKFGLVSGGRTESILMSLPVDASWEYNYQIEKNSLEFKTQELLLKNIDWINIE